MLTETERAVGSFRLEPTVIGGWTFRNGEPGDESQAVDVLSECFTRWPPWPTARGALPLLQWYASGYAPDTGGWIVASDGPRMTSVGLGFGRTVLLGGRRVRGAQEGFIAVRPEYRGRGGLRMYMAMASQERSPDLMWGFTLVEPLLKLRRRDRSIEPANQLSVYVRVLNPVLAARDRPGSTLRHLPGYGFVAARGYLQSRRVRVLRDWRISVDAPFDDRVDAFFESAAEPFDFILYRSAAYLNWRYRDDRAGTFVTLTAEDETGMLGYAAIRLINSRAHLADLLVLPARLDVTESLVEEAVALALCKGASAVECAMVEFHPYSDLLQGMGFVRLSGRSEQMTTKFGVRNFGLDAADFAVLADPHARIHVVEGDSDMI